MISIRRKIFYSLVAFSAAIIVWNTITDSQTQSELEIVKIKLVSNYGHSILKKMDFDYKKHILAFVHIQKTGGSNFDRNIIKHLLVKTINSPNTWTSACHLVSNRTAASRAFKKNKFKNYQCTLRDATGSLKNWYFSRQTFGWICGLHADYSELKRCVPKFYKNTTERDIYYFTILRDPVKRYLSEWRHVARGATWKRKKQASCSNVLGQLVENCYKGSSNWANVSLDAFMSCQYNPGNNRQTRMLAQFDSEFNECSTGRNNIESIYQEDFDRELLIRAKRTLDSMVFFAINEEQEASRFLFEKELSASGDLRFDVGSRQLDSIADTVYEKLEEGVIGKVRSLNKLDLELYRYAVELFGRKIKYFNLESKLVQKHFINV